MEKNMSNEQVQYHSVSEVASTLGVGHQWVLDRIREGSLPAFKISGTAGYRVSSIDLKMFVLSLQNKQNVK